MSSALCKCIYRNNLKKNHKHTIEPKSGLEKLIYSHRLLRVLSGLFNPVDIFLSLSRARTKK